MKNELLVWPWFLFLPKVILKCCKFFSHVHRLHCRLHWWRTCSSFRDFFENGPKLDVKKHDLTPPTYSFQAEETQGNYCNSFFVNSVCSNLRAISGVGCSSLQTLFYCLTFNKGNEENVRSYFSRMKDLLVNIYFICSYFGFEPSFQRHTTSLSENRIYRIGRAPVKDEISTNETI